MSELENSKRGKIARLPARIREEVCRRIHDGESGKKILPWLNSLPETKQLLEEDFEGVRVNDMNLTNWRHTGYAQWLTRRHNVERTKELAKYAADQARASGGSIAEGGVAIAAGKLLELLETVDEKTGQELPVDQIIEVTQALASVRTADQNDVRLAQNDKRLAQKDEELRLARERFKRDTCELFLKWHADKSAMEVANSDRNNADKIEKLGQLMFGDTWVPAAPAAVTEKK